MGKRQRRIHSPGGRYDLREIAARVDRMMRLKGMVPKEVYGQLEMSKGDWSKKVHNKGSSFTVGELDALADIFKAPQGWPFLDDTALKALARALGDGVAPLEEHSSPREASPPAQSGKRRKAGG